MQTPLSPPRILTKGLGAADRYPSSNIIVLYFKTGWKFDPPYFTRVLFDPPTYTLDPAEMHTLRFHAIVVVLSSISGETFVTVMGDIMVMLT